MKHIFYAIVIIIALSFLWDCGEKTPLEPEIIKEYSEVTNVIMTDRTAFVIRQSVDSADIRSDEIPPDPVQIKWDGVEVQPSIYDAKITSCYDHNKSGGSIITYTIGIGSEVYNGEITIPNDVDNITINGDIFTNNQNTNILATNRVDIVLGGVGELFYTWVGGVCSDVYSESNVIGNTVSLTKSYQAGDWLNIQTARMEETTLLPIYNGTSFFVLEDSIKGYSIRCEVVFQ